MSARGFRPSALVLLFIAINAVIWMMLAPPRDKIDLAVDEAIAAPFFQLFQRVHVPKAREVLPAFTYRDAQGREQRLTVRRGELVLLNVWATWCPPCLIELPELDTLARRTAVRVLPISVDQQVEQTDLKGFLEKRGLPLSAAAQDTSNFLADSPLVRGLPTSFLIGEGGEVLYIFEGAAEWAAPESVSFFRAALPS